MSLDNIQLPGIVVQDLFRNSLIGLESNQPVSVSANAGTFPFLGKNEQRIAVLVKDEAALYLSDGQLNFLMGILGACKLSMADIALINLSKNKSITYQELTEQLMAEKIFMFDITPAEIDLPVSFPVYQVQRYNNQVYLSAPTLTALENDRMEKSKLWTCLKQIFSL
ncbi:MAG: hypothetical protein ABJA78_04315 [Ferruginibacter sp.]